ncbi:MAG: peptidase C69 family protein [Chloroflexi bacterium]|nr:MAG: peptidase C69 family protein [Chloroflexota bacterium]
MCDTIVALGNSTADGRVLFAKNSDREPNEAHEVVIIPRAKHDPGSMVKCTYVEIPQVIETHQVLLAKPFWIWGAEMGSNEFGLTIGNEAVFTRVPYGKAPGLIGMDFLRLALERSKTAYEALITITDLLEIHGQSGNCGFAHKMYYHNSFLICDPDEAWVLETAGKEWAAEKIKDIRSISNAITIGSKWDLASRNLVSHAIEKGWCKDAADFSFSRCYSEPVYTLFSDARKRQTCTTKQLLGAKGKLNLGMMMSILRHHGGNLNEKWSPDKGITGADVCMHAGWGPIRGSQTTGSMVSQIDRTDTVHWVTGTSAPCTSNFKPVWMDCGIPETGLSPTGKYDNKNLFWRHEELHREILKDYPHRIRLISEEKSRVERETIAKVKLSLGASHNRRKEISEECFLASDEMERKWLEVIRKEKINRMNRLLYRFAWRTFNKEANHHF